LAIKILDLSIMVVYANLFVTFVAMVCAVNQVAAIESQAGIPLLRVTAPKLVLYLGEVRVISVRCISELPEFTSMQTESTSTSCPCVSILEAPRIMALGNGIDLNIAVVAPEKNDTLFGGIIGVNGTNVAGRAVGIRIDVEGETKDWITWSVSGHLLNLGSMPYGESRTVKTYTLSKRSSHPNQPEWTTLSLTQSGAFKEVGVSVTELGSGQWAVEAYAGSPLRTGIYSTTLLVNFIASDGTVLPYHPIRRVRVQLDGDVAIHPSMLILGTQGQLIEDKLAMRYLKPKKRPEIVSIADGSGNAVNFEIINLGEVDEDQLSLKMPQTFSSLPYHERHLDITFANGVIHRLPVIVMSALK